jgi:hypothetical protein
MNVYEAIKDMSALEVTDVLNVVSITACPTYGRLLLFQCPTETSVDKTKYPFQRIIVIVL